MALEHLSAEGMLEASVVIGSTVLTAIAGRDSYARLMMIWSSRVVTMKVAARLGETFQNKHFQAQKRRRREGAYRRVDKFVQLDLWISRNRFARATRALDCAS